MLGKGMRVFDKVGIGEWGLGWRFMGLLFCVGRPVRADGEARVGE